MTEETGTSGETATNAVGTPMHLWVVGVVSLLWNATGAWDYVMTKTQNVNYMSGFTPEQLDFLNSFPAWVVAVWAVAVWGGVAGSVLLLLRKKLAVPVFLVSLVGNFLADLYGFSNGMEVMGDAFSLIFTAVIFTGTVLLFVYSKAMAGKGVLS
jgi:hypothetical protein